LGYTLQDLQTLEEKERELYGECKKREGIVKEFRIKITALWDLLKIPEEERQSFLRKMIGVGQSTLDKVNFISFKIPFLCLCFVSKSFENNLQLKASVFFSVFFVIFSGKMKLHDLKNKSPKE
jgi:hypothetical protein